MAAASPSPPAGPNSAAEDPALSPAVDGAVAAARVLKGYYAALEAGQYRRAFALREQGRKTVSDAEFAANFAAYQSYRATVGAPSEVVRSGEHLYVEVPVLIYGSYKGGKSFSSAGTVSLRRRAEGAPHEWRIYTGR